MIQHLTKEHSELLEEKTVDLTVSLTLQSFLSA